ncbi:MAG: hypothetical protein M3R67_00085 [Acidobacteriota bacterium]|nr:hypothetical protein [Acidobacteriota bacterium]
MTTIWTPKDTTTHQDHVIAHVLGATVLGYLIFDEALYVLLDIGFIWTIFLDGEMTLLPHPVAVSELEIDELTREQIKADIDVLLRDNSSAAELRRMRTPRVRCLITDVNVFANEEQRRLVLAGEEAGLRIETSLITAEIRVYDC